MISRKRRLASALVVRTGLHRLMRAAVDTCFRPLRIITYHRISEPGTDYPFDPNLISTTAEGFARQLDIIRQDYTPVTFSEITAALKGEERLPKRPVVITFDDGYIDNYRIAYPLLRERGLRACFFVSGDYVRNPRPYWYDILYFLYARASAGCAVASRLLDEWDIDPQRKPWRACLDKLRYGRGGDLLQAIDSMEQVFVDLAQDIDISANISMGEPELSEMARAGMEIGSHGMRHLCIPMLEEQELQHELVESRKYIENVAGVNVTAFAYPFGGAGSYDRNTNMRCHEAGYQWVLANESGVNSLMKADEVALGRLSIDQKIDDGYLIAMLSLPHVFKF